MSTISKVFTVVNIVLSLFLLGSVAAFLSKTTDYKQLWEEEQSARQVEVDALTAERDDALAQKRATDGENTTLTNERQALQADVDAKNVEIDELKNTNNDLRNQLGGLNTSYQSLVSEMTDARSHNKDLQTKVDTFRDERDAAEQAKMEAEDDRERQDREIAALNESIGELERNLSASSDRVTHLESEQAALEAAGVPVKQIVGNTVIPIDGEVSSVGSNFVVLDVGENDGVKVGYPFELYRGGNYIGRVVVDNVKPDNSIARVMFTKEGEAPRVGDSAATRL